MEAKKDDFKIRPRPSDQFVSMFANNLPACTKIAHDQPTPSLCIKRGDY